MIKITGLYKSVSKKGEVFLSGKSLDGTKYFVFKNKKTKDNHPDYNLLMEVPMVTTPAINTDKFLQPKVDKEEFNIKNQIVSNDDDLPF